MRLYSGSASQFVRDSIQNQIAGKLKAAFFSYYRFNPSTGEVNAWRNSLRAMAQVIDYAQLDRAGVLLEYQLPQSSKRLDCLLTGLNDAGEASSVIVELKQWDRCEQSDGEREVVTWIGGAKRDILHPSAQVGQYRSYLVDTHTAFYDPPHPIRLSACAYLHNYMHDRSDVIFAEKYRNILEENPVFTGDQVDGLTVFLGSRLKKGNGLEVLRRVEESRYRPSRKLMDHVSNVIGGKSEYVLLDEQLVVFDKVVAAARSGFHDRGKLVVLIKGGPGTGKSVIALNLMASLLADGYNAHYSTGSKAFTETLRTIVGTRGSVQFRYFNSYTNAEPNDIDVLICDEAHRIRETSNSRYTSRARRSNLPQLEEILRASKVSVFFIDDDQVVRPNEIGSSSYIRACANRLGLPVTEFELEVQFRCSGSEGFVNWISNTLAVRQTANVLWTGHEHFDFRILKSVEALDDVIRKRAAEGWAARLTAGFCWPWSKPDTHGHLLPDVHVGGYARPWNAKPDAGRLAKGIPRASLWAYDPNGIGQIGCVYTAQGFEFDYVGVIWGRDLVYDPDAGSWRGNKQASYDSVVKRSGDRFLGLVKNTYRVLLSRGLKGCYVYFMDRDTERFVRSRMESQAPKEVLLRVAENGAHCYANDDKQPPRS